MQNLKERFSSTSLRSKQLLHELKGRPSNPGVRDETEESDMQWAQDILNDAKKLSAAKQMGFGVVSGWLTGYLSMKAGKMIAVAVGGGIILLQVASHKGYIKINWNKLEKDANKAIQGSSNTSALDKLENLVDRAENKGRRWYSKFVDNGNERYELQELHLFLVSFAAAAAVGVASG